MADGPGTAATSGLGQMERLIGLALFYPKRMVLLWGLLLCLALPRFFQAERHFAGGNGTVAGSDSEQVVQWLQNRFDYPLASFYIITLSSQHYGVEHPVFKQNVQALLSVLKQQNDTRLISSWYDAHDPLMLSADHRKTWVLVGQKYQSERELQARIPLLRSQLSAQQKEWHSRDPSFVWHHTGMDALNHDILNHTLASTAQAERQVLFFTLPLLILAFGSLVAVILPVLMALFSNIISLSLLSWVAQWLPISVYAQSITSMLSFALGIDYALLMVWRWRESRNISTTERVKPMGYAADALLLAGLTFGVGLSGLWLAPLMPLYSIGIGGVIVILINLALALTLLPALLSWSDPFLDFPQPLSKHLFHFKPAVFWGRLCRTIMARPWRFMGVTGAVLMVGIYPAGHLQIGELDLLQLPAHLEAKKGIGELQKMSSPGLIAPLQIVVTRQDGQSIINQADLKQVRKLHQYLSRHPAVGRIQGLSALPWEDNAGLARQLTWLEWMAPDALRMFVSQDHKLLLLQVIPRQLEPFDAVTKLAHQLRQNPPTFLNEQGLLLTVGGPAGLILDFNEAAFAAIPRMIPVVLGLTYLVLFVALRSWLLPLKAIVLNLCSVGLSYSALVIVFQWGWWPSTNTSPIMAYVPILLFCLIFGMSIDYEVFLLTRIKEAHEQGCNNTEATIQGVQGTGDVITYAALLMCFVFGAFMLVEISVIRQLGLGLTVAVLADATLIRMIMVPALMRIAGRWNWVPGSR